MIAKTKQPKRRRRNGEGSIFQRADGKWCATVTVGYSGAGKRVRRTIYGKTMKAVRDELTTVSPVRPEAKLTARQAHNRAANRLTAIVEALEKPLDHSAETADIDLDAKIVSNTTPADYMAMVKRAKDYIAAGDIFQVVLSQRFEAPFPLPAFALYRALRPARRHRP